VGPTVEYSKAEATFDKSSSSKNSGSESEKAVELKRAKEVSNLERVDGATETVPRGVGLGKSGLNLRLGSPYKRARCQKGSWAGLLEIVGTI
jgi:hypothetical protein